MRALIIAAVLAGCGFSPPAMMTAGDASVTPGSDAGSGACVTATEQFDTCALGSGSDLTLTKKSTYNSDTGTLTINGSSTVVPVKHAVVATPTGPLDVLVTGMFDVEATLTLAGTMPVAIYAAAGVEIGDQISVTAGAPVACTNGPVVGSPSSSGAGGGGGGAFAGSGGPGLAGGSAAAGSGGDSMARPTGLVGGCPGAQGGTGGSTTLGGIGGAGGGALLVVTPHAISIKSNSGIDAGGDGGGGAVGNQAGGGGGGAGGMIVLEADTISNMGFVTANGGGGGEGAGTASNDTGDDGSPGTTSTTQAKGGSGGTSEGGNGGSGGAGSMLAGDAPTDTTSSGGGGGGGGAGYVAFKGALTVAGTFSPAATPWP